MIGEALEATALAQTMKTSRWIYPLVNTGHILGLALLIGSVVPMDLRLLGRFGALPVAGVVALLRPVAASGLALAVACGAALFVTQAGDYLSNGWFRAKMALLVFALANVALHLRLGALSPARRRVAALGSLTLWPAVLLTGRMIGYS